MTHASIQLYFYLALFGGFFAGLAAVILWAKRIFPGLMEKINAQQGAGVPAIAGMAFAYMLPGILLFALFCLPMFYFGGLLRQRGPCLQVVRAEKGTVRDNPAFLEQCGAYDFDELLRDAGVTKGE